MNAILSFLWTKFCVKWGEKERERAMRIVEGRMNLFLMNRMKA